MPAVLDVGTDTRRSAMRHGPTKTVSFSSFALGRRGSRPSITIEMRLFPAHDGAGLSRRSFPTKADATPIVTFETDALQQWGMNQGKVANGRKSSRPSSSSQNPWTETFVTSTPEVTFPRAADLIFVLPHQAECRHDQTAAQALIQRQLNIGFHPEFRLPASVEGMHVHPRLLSREEQKLEPGFLEDGRTHGCYGTGGSADSGISRKLCSPLR